MAYTFKGVAHAAPFFDPDQSDFLVGPVEG